MRENEIPWNRGAVRPFVCLQEGWSLIKQDYGMLLGITFVGMLISGVAPLGILHGPMMCGIFLCLFAQQHRRSPEFSLLFKGFDYFLESFVATMFMVVPMMLIVGPAYILMFVAMMNMGAQAGGQPPDPKFFLFSMGGFYLLLFAVIFVSAFLFFFTYQLIVDYRLKGFAAVKLGISASFANFGGVIGLLLLMFAIDLVGFMFCCVGIYFVMPLNYAAYAVAYRQVFPDPYARDDDDRDDDYDEPDSPRRLNDERSTGFQPRPQRDRAD